jgi:beta-glucanase (GH16 family)
MKAIIIHLVFFGILFSQRPYRGAEYRTIDTFQYGRFEIRMKSASGSGTVSSFFTINDYWAEGISGSENWQEIDWEALGQYSNKFQTNIITAYETSHEQLHTLQYNPHVGFQTYAFEWTPDHIDFYINGQLIRRDSNSYVSTFNSRQKIMMNIWQPIWEDWVGAFDPSILPIYAFYDWVRYYSYTPGLGDSGTDNNFTFEWMDNFNFFDQSRWQKATHTWNGNNSQFVQENAVLEEGYLILCLTDNLTSGYSGDPLELYNDERATGIENLTIFPNPFNSSFDIKIPGHINNGLSEVKLINLKGETIYRSKKVFIKNNTITFNTKNNLLSSGLYFGILETGQGIYKFKVTYVQ